MNPNIMMTVVFFIIFIVLFTIYVYHLYDYMGHKENVDKSIEISTAHMNDSFKAVSENLSATDTKLSGKMVDFSNATNTSLQNMRSNQDAIQQRSNNLRKDIEFVEKKHIGIASEISKLRSTINVISTNERNTNVDMRQLHKKQAEIIGHVNSNSLRNNTFLHKFASIETDVKGLTEEIKGIDGNFAILTDKNNILRNEVSGVMDNYRLLGDKSTLLSNSMKDMNTSFKTMDDNTKKDIRAIEEIFNAEKASMATNVKGIRDRLTDLDSKNNHITGEIQALLAMSINPNMTENVEKLRDMYKTLNDKHFSVKQNMEALQNLLQSSFLQISKIEGLQKILDDTDATQKTMLDDIKDLKSSRDVMHGLIIKTSKNLVDPKNFKICNEADNCMNFNTNHDGFNMTPENISRFTINSTNKTAFGRLNLENDNLYLKGNVGIGMETVKNRKLEVISNPQGSVSVIGSGDARYHCYNEGGVQEWLWGQKGTTSHSWSLSSLKSGTETDMLVVTSAGNVGVGIAEPTARLDVIAPATLLASFRHSNLTQGIGINYNGIIAIGSNQSLNVNITAKGNGVIRANSRLVVNNSVNGGTNRGIMLWNAEDSSWGMYMGEAGANRSFSGGTACNGANFSSHALRLRTNNLVSNGIILENSREQCLMSVRGSDGMSYFMGNVGIGTPDPLEKLHVDGNAVFNGGQMHLLGESPTIYFRDTDNRPAMLHVNSNRLYLLRGKENGSSEWATVNGRWPLIVNLENNNSEFGGDLKYHGKLMSGNTDIIKQLQDKITALETRLAKLE